MGFKSFVMYNPVLLKKDTPISFKQFDGLMTADGYHFFESNNHVWLTKEVPVRYLKKEWIIESHGQRLPGR